MHPITKTPVLNGKGEKMDASFYIKNDPTWFQDEVIFRPIAAWQKYYTYNAYKNKYEGETVYIRSTWDDEQKKYIVNQPYDNLGTLRLGRPDTEEFKKLDHFTQQMWRTKAKWQMCLFGLVYFSNKAEPILVEFSYAGKKGMDILEMLKGIKRPLWQQTYITNLELNGDHWQPAFKKLKFELAVDMNEQQKTMIKKAVIDTYKHGDAHDAKIMKAHEEALTGKALEEFKKNKPVLTSNLDEEVSY